MGWVDSRVEEADVLELSNSAKRLRRRKASPIDGFFSKKVSREEEHRPPPPASPIRYVHKLDVEAEGN
jgi:hypothetical protein